MSINAQIHVGKSFTLWLATLNSLVFSSRFRTSRGSND